jgi:GH43 family beta-xylosidase
LFDLWPWIVTPVECEEPEDARVEVYPKRKSLLRHGVLLAILWYSLRTRATQTNPTHMRHAVMPTFCQSSEVTVQTQVIRFNHRKLLGWFGASVLALTALTAPGGHAAQKVQTFTNPVVQQESADPWVIRHDGYYYFTGTLEPDGGLWIWKSKTLTGLNNAEKVKVWTAPTSGLRSRMIWAPELHHLSGPNGKRWYLYYSASDQNDANHRHYVLEAQNPLGPYVDRGLVQPDYNSFAIDGSVLKLPDGRLFWMYSTGVLNISKMTSPTRAVGPSTVFHPAYYEWEHEWRLIGSEYAQGTGYWVEAPQVLMHKNRVFVVYSAGHSGAKYYLGLLELIGKNPLDPKAWKSYPKPIFAPYEGKDGSVYVPGHNSFTLSPDGKENWIVYHGKETPEAGFLGRTTRIQPFTWKADGTPNLGHPIPSGVPIRKPSGE